MRWQNKSKIQRTLAALPVGRESLYYLLQKTGGRLREKPDPRENFRECVKAVSRIHKLGARVTNARIMEVGTGWALDMPIGLYLCGAASIQTFDLHPYLRRERVEQTINSIREKKEQIRDIFATVMESEELGRRLDTLCQTRTTAELMSSAKIKYMAPADATNTGLPAESIDIQFSYTVFEHIPENVITGILREASRILTKTGFCFHHIDPSDHFSHDDKSISAVNFLRYSDQEWERYAGNQFAYHNRLRSRDFKRIFEESGHRLLQFDAYRDKRSLEELKAGFPLHEKYRGIELEALCETVAVAVSVPVKNPGPG